MRELRERCTWLLDQLADRLDPETLGIYQRMNFAGEWMLLADNVAATLVKDQIPVSAAEREALRLILYAFNTESTSYSYVAARDDVMASLVVTDPDPE